MSGLPLAGDLTHTTLRTPDSLCAVSGMCAACSDHCAGTCDIGLSALRGSEAAYPYDSSSHPERTISSTTPTSTSTAGSLVPRAPLRIWSIPLPGA